MKKILFAFFSIFALSIFTSSCVDKYNLTPNQNNSGNKDNGPVEMTEEMLKVISFNIKTGSNTETGVQGWPYRKASVIKLLKAENPTVFGVQEAMKSQLDYMKAELTEYDSYGVGRGDGISSSEHMTIFWKKDEIELGQHGTFWLAEGAPTSPVIGWDAAIKRTVTWAIMTHKATGNKFLYMNTHLDHSGATARQQSVILIRNKIAELNSGGYPVVLTGDFNLDYNHEYLEPLKRVMYDARIYAPRTDQGTTCHGWSGKTQVIDHIFYNKFNALEFDVIREGHGIDTVSDHYPVSAILEFKK